MPEWRYSKWNNVLFSSKGSEPHYIDRIKEVQDMVETFHKAGIRVVMDVVYNHTYNKDVFGNISDKYYTKEDLSRCGNSVDASNPMVSRMIRDSLEYWVTTYNIDGFRFDLIGIFGYEQVKDWATYLNKKYPDRKLIFYGEPWNGYAGDPQENTRVRLGTISLTERIEDGRPVAQVGAFNPKFRDALKGATDS